VAAPGRFGLGYADAFRHAQEMVAHAHPIVDIDAPAGDLNRNPTASDLVIRYSLSIRRSSLGNVDAPHRRRSPPIHPPYSSMIACILMWLSASTISTRTPEVVFKGRAKLRENAQIMLLAIRRQHKAAIDEFMFWMTPS